MPRRAGGSECPPTDGWRQLRGRQRLPRRLVWFWHPYHGGTVIGTWFGPGPRDDTIAVTYGRNLLLVSTSTWTITS